MRGIWAELGIEPTQETTAIRRAYAARLKAVQPDQDPQAFNRLRGAYERALALAKAPVAAKPRSQSPEPPLTDPQSPPAAPTPEPLPAPEPVLDFLRRGEVVGAADWLIASRSSGQLTLQGDMRFADQLGWSMAQDRNLAANQVRAAADRLGWPQQAAGAWAAELKARLDAEQWLARLRRDAASWTRWTGGSSAVVARTLLGRGRLHLLPSTARDPMLRKRYGEFLLHAPAVGEQFDPERIQAVGAVLTRPMSKPMWAISAVVLLLVFPWAAGKLAADVNQALQAPVTLATGIGVLILTALVLQRRQALRRRRKSL